PKQFTAMTAATDEGVFMRNEYRYGVDGRCNVGLGFWQMAAKSQETLDAEGFEKAYNAMVSLKGDGGRPLGIRPNVLLVPPSLENAAKKLVEGDRLDSGAYNPNKGKCKVIVSPWLL
ncbi:MAG: Mu-like prophage major head subunit gpT family protein, partial [Neisseria subflava]|nr:Mu-like prophage major head subunit gpT family protein [Neisseria subflava]